MMPFNSRNEGLECLMTRGMNNYQALADGHAALFRDHGGVLQVDPEFARLTLRLVSALETHI